MKPLLLLLLGCFNISYAEAQNDPSDNQKLNVDSTFRFQFQNGLSVPVRFDTTISLKDMVQLKSRKPGVYRLQQDGMPCIVPDTNTMVFIPNVWKGNVQSPFKSQPPVIPNPSLRSNGENEKKEFSIDFYSK